MSENSKRRRHPASLLAAGVGLTALLMGGCATTKSPVSGSDSPDAINRPTNCQVEEPLGICIEGVRRSAAGYMLDLRYQVVDPEKARALVDRKVHPYLLDQASGARLFVPSSAKIGPLRQTTGKPVAGQTLFALFANPGRYVEAGRNVTLVVGDRRVENLAVLE